MRALHKFFLGLLVILLMWAATALAQSNRPCPSGTLYLTIDTGWGREAEKIADILRRLGIRATLFVANEPTHRGNQSLDPAWTDFWRARAAEGHVFASYTDRHWYFRSDPTAKTVRYVSRGSGHE